MRADIISDGELGERMELEIPGSPDLRDAGMGLIGLISITILSLRALENAEAQPCAGKGGGRGSVVGKAVRERLFAFVSLPNN
mmetsp:Transcript_27246/g.62498  ORF Transcript_27246/g.62498 Transcript_27246/m.62498 type:complete len:83 (-) Transcript_27246:6-254(-)